VETAPGVTATATVLNFTGVNNVRVDGVVRNDGDAPLTNLKVRLMWSLKDGDYVAGQTQTLAQLLPGQSINVSFTAAGLAGMNRYLIVVDPDNERPDADRSNNVGQTGVFIQGLPDLKVQDFTLDQATPMQGVPLKLNATLQNVGIDDAQNVEVEVYARLLAAPGPSGQLPASGLLVGKVKLDLVKALSSASLSIDIDTPKLIGAVELSLVVDPNLKILEATDLNNAVTKTFTFVKKGARVEGRRVFYNNSKFDGKTPGPAAADDAAVATDKQALLPGQTATFANLTSYARGINGVMIDVADLPRDQTVSVEDFGFKVGNSLSTTGWVNAPAASSVTVRRGAGANGSDRITIIWPDGAIKNKWLQVMVRANTRTGLTAPDVFYFGNLVGETGNAAAPAVNALDVTATRSQVSTKAAGVTSRFDFDHNGRVDAGDLATVRGAMGKSLVTFAAPPVGAASAAGSDWISGRYRPSAGTTFTSGRVIDSAVDSDASAAILN
jgi:hypothetical protein